MTRQKKEKKSLAERIADAEARSAMHLENGNDEWNAPAKQAKSYDKAQYWLDVANKLRGNS